MPTRYVNYEFHPADMNNPDDKIGIGEGEGESEGLGQGQPEGLDWKFPLTPIAENNNQCSTQASRVNNSRDDETRFYNGMTFKNKQKLEN